MVQVHLYNQNNIFKFREVKDMSNVERHALVSTNEVEKLMLNIRGMDVLLDRDMAMLYGVETRVE